MRRKSAILWRDSVAAIVLAECDRRYRLLPTNAQRSKAIPAAGNLLSKGFEICLTAPRIRVALNTSVRSARRNHVGSHAPRELATKMPQPQRERHGHDSDR